MKIFFSADLEKVPPFVLLILQFNICRMMNNVTRIPCHVQIHIKYHTPHTKSHVKGDEPQCIHTQSMDSSAKNVLKPTMHCNVEFITFLLYPPPTVMMMSGSVGHECRRRIFSMGDSSTSYMVSQSLGLDSTI